ncbi:MAG TPA: DUF523 domain-containing protein [Desulfobacteraceae bacterium]|nr:DUF523 domain-containing protein [Desulfobacteraceae bacterium]
MLSTRPEICLVSACLAGLCTRYDGQRRYSFACMRKLAGRLWIPVCPEQLGGLPTPRTAADLTGGDGHDVLAGRASVITRDGLDVTRNFILGAEECLAVIRAQHIGIAYLKGGSPSCGLTPKTGVAAALLLQHGIRIIES